MNCSNPSPENDKKDVCRSAYHKRYYAENRERILARQKRWRTENPQAMKARNRRWYEKNMERLASSSKNNRERLNDYWRGYYAKNKERINQRLRRRRQRKKRTEYRAVWGLGPRIWESGYESSSQPVRSYTLWNISINSYIKKSFIFISVWSLTFYRDVCFLTTKATIIFLSFSLNFTIAYALLESNHPNYLAWGDHGIVPTRRP